LADRTKELLTELVKLRTAWESRVVEVKAGDLTTTLFLNFGEIAAVKASRPGEPIGRILVRKGLITREHYLEVLERLGEVLNTGARVAFGEVAVGLGYAKAADVSACLAEQVRALAMRIFQAEDPEWTVLPLPADRDPSRDLTMRVEAVFLDAIRLLDDTRKGTLGLDAARPLALRPSWELQEIDVRLELTAEEAEFVHTAVAGDKTVDELLRADVAASVDRAAVLTALVASGAAESRKPVAAEQRDKPERRKEPPALPAWAAVDATKAKDAAETAARVRRSLSPPKPTSSPLEQMLRAEQMFERGREIFCRGDVKGAQAEFERALQLNPTSVEYQLFSKWSQHRLSGAALAPPARSELENLARGALRENPRLAIAHVVLSLVHEASGLRDEARTDLSRARDLDRELFDSVQRLVPATAPTAARAQVAAPAQKVSKPRAQGMPMSLVLGALLLVLGLVVVGVVVFRNHGTASAPPVSTAPPPQVAQPSDAGAVTATIRDASAEGGSRSDAGASAPRPVDPAHGVVHLPKSAESHRVFVDGRTYATEGDNLIVLCGHHEIRIGSQGTPHPIDVPCGGEVDFH
jgi:tetratricopeptide (TPR) repeat protein